MIVHPLVLIEMIRHVVNHDLTSEIMHHTTLNRLPFWRDLRPELAFALKKLLHHFHLVYQAGKTLLWNSDLIVPAYWSRRHFAHVIPLLPPMQLEDSTEVAARVQWEFVFGYDIPFLLWEHIAAASFSSRFSRRVRPFCISYTSTNTTANPFLCRLWLRRDD